MSPLLIRDSLARWNRIAKEAKVFIEDTVTYKLRVIEKENSLGEDFISDIKWTLLSAIIENEYINSKCKGIPIFSLDLLKIYEVGNYPCGWDDSVILGGLIIY